MINIENITACLCHIIKSNMDLYLVSAQCPFVNGIFFLYSNLSIIVCMVLCSLMLYDSPVDVHDVYFYTQNLLYFAHFYFYDIPKFKPLNTI